MGITLNILLATLTLLDLVLQRRKQFLDRLLLGRGLVIRVRHFSIELVLITRQIHFFKMKIKIFEFFKV